VGREGTALALARVRLVGARWRKRNAAGVVRGLADADTVAPGGALELGPVGRVTEGEGYVSPPGVNDELQNSADEFGAMGGMEFNEKALSLRYSELPPGSRAEAVLPLDDRPRNLLAYRELRFWVAAPRGETGMDVLLRAGTSPDNAYLYRHRLARVGRPAVPSDWTEVVVDLARWTALRTRAEAALRDRREAGGGQVVVWDADSLYAVVVGDRGRAPNLAALREVAFGVWNGSASPRSGEVWIDDVRLGGASARTSGAAQVSVSLTDVGGFSADLTYTANTGYFIQSGAAPTYQGESALTLTTRWQLGRILPKAWGLDAPLTFSHQAAGSSPLIIAQTDMPAGEFAALRRPHTGSTRAQLELASKPRPTGTPSSVFTPLRLKIGYESADATALYGTQRRAQVDVAAHYQVQPRARAFRILPDSIGRGGGLLGRLGRTRAIQGIAGARLRWNPAAITWKSEFLGGSDQRAQFEHFDADDDSVTATQHTARRGVTQDLGVAFRPFASIEADANLRWQRDLLPNAEQNSTAPEAIEQERWRVGGLDLGRLARRSVATRFAWNPVLASWLTTQWSSTATFNTDANPAYLRSTAEAGDTARALLRNLDNRRTVALRSGFTPSLLANALGFRQSGSSRSLGRGFQSLLGIMGPIEAEWTHSLQARFDRTHAQRGVAREFGMGGRDALLRAGRDTADESSDLSRFAVRTRLDLPWAFGLTIGSERTATQFGGSRGGREDHDVVWPDLQLQWSGVPLGGLTRWLVNSTSLEAGYTRRRVWAEDGSSAVADAREEITTPVSLTAALKGGLSFNYRFDSRLSADTTLSGRTRRTDGTHALSLAGAIRPSVPFAPALREPVSVTLALTQADRQGCRPAAPARGCSAETQFARERERMLRLQLDTRVKSLRVGLHGDFLERRSLIGERNGSGQFGIGLFAEYELTVARTPQASTGGSVPITPLTEPARPPPLSAPQKEEGSDARR